jgi:proteasome accessory factor B
VQSGELIGTRGAASRASQHGQHPWELGDGEIIRARIKIGAAQALWARAHLGEGAVVQREEDGSIVFGLDVRNVDAFRSFVLGFLDRAEILEPAELRTDMIVWLDGILAFTTNESAPHEGANA